MCDWCFPLSVSIEFHQYTAWRPYRWSTQRRTSEEFCERGQVQSVALIFVTARGIGKTRRDGSMLLGFEMRSYVTWCAARPSAPRGHALNFQWCRNNFARLGEFWKQRLRCNRNAKRLLVWGHDIEWKGMFWPRHTHTQRW